MIRSFPSKALSRFAAQGDASKLSVPNARRVQAILARLDAATRPEQLDAPGLRFHPLKGRDKGRFAVDASGNGGSHLAGTARTPSMSIWRITTDEQSTS